MSEAPERQRLRSRRRGRGFGGGLPEARMSMDEFEVIEQQSGAEAGSPARSIEGWDVVVTGIHEEATEDDLHDKLGEYGIIRSMHLNLDRRTGFVKGYAFVEYASRNEAEAAISALDGSIFMGKPMYVDWAFQVGSVSALPASAVVRDRSQSPQRHHHAHSHH